MTSQVGHGIENHAYITGLIYLNWLKLCRLRQSTKLNVIFVLIWLPWQQINFRFIEIWIFPFSVIASIFVLF